MRVTNVADACILFEHAGTRLLADPWIGTPTNGYWLQYPPPVISPEDIGALDYIFISHLHEDHCDLATIARLDPSAEILVMDRQPHLLLDHLRNHGIPASRIRSIPGRTPLQLGADLVLEPIEANPDHEYSRLVDSAMLLHTEAGTVYFANDAEPHESANRYIASRYRVQLALLPFYGGSGYPACYTNLTHDEKLLEVARIQRSYLESMARCFQSIQPERVTPVASWHCFAGAVAHLNPMMSWPQSYDGLISFMEDLGREAPMLEVFSPGQGIDLSTGERIGGPFRPFAPDDRQAFAESHLRDVRPRWEGVPNSPAIRVERLFAHACESFRTKVRYDFDDGFRYVIDCGEGRYYVLEPRSGKDEVAESIDTLEPPYLKIFMDRRLFALLLIGALSWNLEDAGGMLRYERVPNVYRPEAYVALNFLKI